MHRISRGAASHKNIAIVALARKRLVTHWALLRDGTSWRDPTRFGSAPDDTEPVAAVFSVAGAPP